MTGNTASPARTLAGAVLAQARRGPAAPAVADGEHVLDYAELDRLSEIVAHGLRARGVLAGQAVAVCLPRSWQLVCVMLGIRRAGATVVPLDAQSPAGRRRHILDDSGAVALVHDDPAGSPHTPSVTRVSAADLLSTSNGNPPSAMDGSADGPDSPAGAPAAFLFYTSGTTGMPKGVEVGDAGILRLASPGPLRPAAGARCASLSNPAFDALSFEIWVPLLTGGTCVVLSDEQTQDPRLLADTLRRTRIDTLFVTTALFNAVVDKAPDCFDSVARVLVGGEQLNAARIRGWYRDNPASATQLVNVYGPTEATTFALCHPVPRGFDGDVVPVGRPLPGTGALLVADGSRPAETDEVAELHLSGEGLAAGYRNLPEETERRFVRLAWHDGGRERWYRTGDLARRDADGLITFVGRADRQVKVRGFRVEPGEVERQLAAHPAVRQAHVCTRRDADGAHELLAHLVLGSDLTLEEYDRHLTATLPPYMRPHRTHLLDALPRTANGKVDESALLNAHTQPWRRTPTGASTEVTAQQRKLLQLAEGILDVRDLRPDDRWVPNGGDSLKALRLRFEIRRAFQADVPQSLVLSADFASLADAVTAATGGAGPLYPPPPAPTGRRSAPATSEQQRLWLLHRRDPHSRAYDVPLAFRLDGAVDEDALRAALDRLVRRHPALRTGFHATADGLLQTIGEPYDPWQPADVRDGEDWREAAARFFAPAFDLAGGRMLRAGLLDGADGRVLLLHLHHIAVDGWSLNVLLSELSTTYAPTTGNAGPLHDSGLPGASTGPAAAPLAPAATPADPSVTPADYALWQQQWHSSPAYRDQRAALRRLYARLDPPEPLFAPHSGAARGRARLRVTVLDEHQRVRLDRLGGELGLTRFQLLLAVFSWSLYGVTGATRPLIAAPVAGRPVAEIEDTVGMFANTVLLPADLVPQEGLRAQLLRQSATAGDVLSLQDVALSDVLADHPFGVDGPPFDAMFVLENTDFDLLTLPGCRVRPLWPEPAEAKCALTLSVVERDGGLDCLWEYAEDRIDAERVTAAAELFRRGVDLLNDGANTTTLADLVGPYRHSLPDHGRGPELTPAFTTVAEGFARQVGRTPDAPAVTGADRTLSYAQLDAQAARLADQLRSRHPLPADPAAPARVALYLTPSPEHIVALLAAARLNITVVPLDPAYPADLLRRILRQVDPLCVLVAPGGDHDVDAIAPPALPRHTVDLSDAPPPGPQPVPPRHDGLRPLYTLFTSGSTGTPKGVDVPDRTLCNLVHWQSEAGGLGGAATTQQFSMLSFDVSFQEILTTLCTGGHLHLVRPEWRQDLPALLHQLETTGAERLFLPYVALQLLAEHGVHLGVFPSRLREVVTAGEQLVCTDAIRRWFSGLSAARLFNHYGPTETHVVSSLCLEGDPALWPARPAIGRPVANAVLRVVDTGGAPLPPGATGDLLIGGPMTAPCYLGDPDLNRERFTDLPGLGTFYRSGDHAHFDTDGLLHYDGRRDEQIKLSGHRLELGQVEAALSRHPRIMAALVVRDGDGLVAVLRIRGDDPDPGELDRHLAALLPPHVRIRDYRRADALPRTPSGKLDRRAAPSGRALRATEAMPPGAASAREARLCELFETATGHPVAPDQRFFDAGASSLDLMRFHLRCRAELGLTFTVADLFEHVTVRRLSRFLDGPDPAPATTGVLGEREHAPDDAVAVVGMAVRVPGARDLAAFWRLVETGARGVEHFPAADGLVGARSQMDGLLAFDPDRFGISRQEARLMDPQQRHLLMSCVEALAHAGIADPAAHRVGLIAGCGENTYYQAMLREADPADLPDGFRMALHHEKDFLATKTAYHLGLTGPAFTVQAACSSSLVGVHVAAGLLRQGDADVMLAGGVLVDTQLTDGYVYRPQHIFSPDGHCRPFSDDAAGTVGASGVGVVVLKSLRRARLDGDTVYAVITGSALNNDGSDKLGYSAPSVAGQREVIRTALRRSGRVAADIGYVEAHGTGTRLGDPVEVGALRQAFGLADSASCALSSVKSQIGHLGAAAGVVGLVRAALAVHHGVIPPNVDFRRLNPEIGDDLSPFHIPVAAQPWPAGRPRVAAVSSFGIGGTNAHLVLEHPGDTAPAPAPVDSPRLVLSSASESALRADAERVADYLAARPETYPQVLRHLQAGRPALRHRAAALCPDADSAVVWLRTVGGTPTRPPVADRQAQFPFPGRESELSCAVGAAEDGQTGPATAPAPWDFPPPAFDLTDHDFPRAPAGPASDGPATTGTGAVASPARQETPPSRAPLDRWLHQTEWARTQRALPATGTRAARLVVVVSEAALPPAGWSRLTERYARVVHVTPGPAYARLAPDRYEVDPADPASLTRLLQAVRDGGEDGWDWLHALPLAVTGRVGEPSLRAARRACLDTPAALCRALADLPEGRRPRVWWLSHGAQPVTGRVRRPELGLLAGAVEVPRQELGLDARWVDLPTPEPVDWAHLLPQVLDDTREVPERQPRLALRQGYWWRPAVRPVPRPHPQAPTTLTGATGTHLVLGGTGGIGTSLAAWLLERTDGHVVLLARRPALPSALERWSARVTVVRADLAEDALDAVRERLAPHLGRLDGVIHAVGTAAGGLLARRDGDLLLHATQAKLRAALLTERLIAEHRPRYAVYCSSLSSLFGGVGQFDYAACAGVLDAFAHHGPADPSGTVRLGIGWDVWRDTGMALDSLRSDPRHQAHLRVGLSTAEALEVFEDAVELQLPHLLVSTTAPEEARFFYEPAPASPTAAASAPGEAVAADVREHPEEVTDIVRRLLGVDALDSDASLYDLGADSLTLLDLLSEVKRRHGVDIDLSRLGHRVSLNEILAHLAPSVSPRDDGEHSGDDTVSVEVWQPGEGGEVLCLVHPVGGDIQAYRPLVSALAPRTTVCLIPDPALRDPGLPARSVDERAARYLAAVRARFPGPDTRFRFAGWSFGAWIALSMAAEAEAAGRPAEALYLLDPPAPGAGALLNSYDDHDLRTVFAHELRGNDPLTPGDADDARDRATPDSTRDAQDARENAASTSLAGPAQAYAERLARCCRTNLAAMAAHTPPRLLRTPTTVWLADRPVTDLPAPAPRQHAAGEWRALLPDGSPVHHVDATHYEIVTGRHAEHIAELINEGAPPFTPRNGTRHRPDDTTSRTARSAGLPARGL
ncbi:amino acid adenylation domain-containing protein [Streptomyces sp. NPDC005574]|uniref:amino acid adenylation domain-containing protein n=1 Tax=Streptomyces sp. NPDC005574 TaxID=3156891 RepID=UPI0033A06AAF